MDIEVAGRRFKGLDKFNLLLGKNGCGKSTLLRDLFSEKRSAGGVVRYVTPERGGDLSLDGNFETNRRNDDWFVNVTTRNRFEQFRQSSITEFRNLRELVRRKIDLDPETRNSNFSFGHVLSQINGLLDNVRIEEADGGGLEYFDRKTGVAREANVLSSGETELISLAIEVLSFMYKADLEKNKDKENWLLLDEPDVHLHPDLQVRLMTLVAEVFEGKSARLLLATHSTSIVAALAQIPGARVCLMKSGEKEIAFRSIDKTLRQILPIFGAHPLSNIFNEKPILLVEGEDEVRIWQQAVRSAQGKLKLWPVAAGSKQDLSVREQLVREISEAIYDNARAYSLRDRDDAPYEIDDIGPVVRMRLNCRASENLLLSDDVLELLKTDWPTVQAALAKWAEEEPEHQQTPAIRKFEDSGWDRRTADIKQLRNLILALAGSEKQWEQAVGQTIAALCDGKGGGDANGLRDFLGPKLVAAFHLQDKQEAVAA